MGLHCSIITRETKESLVEFTTLLFTPLLWKHSTPFTNLANAKQHPRVSRISIFGRSPIDSFRSCPERLFLAPCSPRSLPASLSLSHPCLILRYALSMKSTKTNVLMYS